MIFTTYVCTLLIPSIVICPLFHDELVEKFVVVLVLDHVLPISNHIMCTIFLSPQLCQQIHKQKISVK